jgi:hypothetical protein
VRLPDYRVLRWLQIAGICLLAGVLSMLFLGLTSGVIFLAGAVIFVIRAVVEYLHLRES